MFCGRCLIQSAARTAWDPLIEANDEIILPSCQNLQFAHMTTLSLSVALAAPRRVVLGRHVKSLRRQRPRSLSSVYKQPPLRHMHLVVSLPRTGFQRQSSLLQLDLHGARVARPCPAVLPWFVDFSFQKEIDMVPFLRQGLQHWSRWLD